MAVPLSRMQGQLERFPLGRRPMPGLLLAFGVPEYEILDVRAYPVFSGGSSRLW